MAPGDACGALGGHDFVEGGMHLRRSWEPRGTRRVCREGVLYGFVRGTNVRAIPPVAASLKPWPPRNECPPTKSGKPFSNSITHRRRFTRKKRLSPWPPRQVSMAIREWFQVDDCPDATVGSIRSLVVVVSHPSSLPLLKELST